MNLTKKERVITGRTLKFVEERYGDVIASLEPKVLDRFDDMPVTEPMERPRPCKYATGRFYGIPANRNKEWGVQLGTDWNRRRVFNNRGFRNGGRKPRNKRREANILLATWDWPSGCPYEFLGIQR
jgi:hypothetical protein